MRSNNAILLMIATAFFAAGLWSGCTVGFNPEQDGVFPCETSDDCLDGYECAETKQVCQKISTDTPDAPPCDQSGDPEGDIDLDNDGYGTGENRTQCPETGIDCDDDNAAVNPGAAESCNNIDDDCDTEVDEFECTGEDATTCGDPPGDLGDYLYYTCRSNTCTLVPFNQKPELQCDQMFITCNSSEQAFTYELDGQSHPPEDVPGECR